MRLKKAGARPVRPSIFLVLECGKLLEPLTRNGMGLGGEATEAQGPTEGSTESFLPLPAKVQKAADTTSGMDTHISFPGSA